MPTVAHYICPKDDCQSLVTHEIVHESEDLKHDAHLVKQFTTKSISTLEKSNIPIHKIIEFTNQAQEQNCILVYDTVQDSNYEKLFWCMSWEKLM